MALLMTASGSLAHRQILPVISSKSTVSQAKWSTFATNHALSKITHTLRRIVLLKSIHGLLFNNIVWSSWKYILKYAALIALLTEKVPSSGPERLLLTP